MRKLVLSLFVLVFLLTCLAGFASASYYSNHYGAGYSNMYPSPANPPHYPNFDYNVYYMHPAPIVFNNYYNNNYYFDTRYDRSVTYRQPYPVYYQMNCNTYYVGHQCSITSYPPVNGYYGSY